MKISNLFAVTNRFFDMSIAIGQQKKHSCECFFY